MSSPPLTVGTAGHVDHGKSALVRALTGKDPDRLPEERRRGLSVDLGFAPLEVGGGRRLSLVDVPGHERFVRTMVAGATGVDMYLMCIAADDGVMPQTREHAAVLRHLAVTRGVVAVTKGDLADPARAVAEAAELLPEAPVVVTSARSGEGLDELRSAVGSAAEALEVPVREGPTRLHVDRAFTLRGIGTVVTGTLWAGSLGSGDVVRLLPDGPRARVRSVQVHDSPVERAQAGQRVAVALAGVDRDQVARGDVLADRDSPLDASYRLDVALNLDGELEPHARLQVHHGTRESPARVVPLGQGYAQLRLESPLVCARGDRVVLRRVAPPATVGGGVVVDPAPRRHGPSAAVVDHLRGGSAPAESEPGEPGAPNRSPLGLRPPRSPPSPRRRSRWCAAALEADGLQPRPDVLLASDLGLRRPELDAALASLVRAGDAVRVGPAQHYDAAALRRAGAEVVSLCRRDGAATIASVRDELGTSRKYAQAVLEHLDRTRVTRRVGDEHVLRRRTPR